MRVTGPRIYVVAGVAFAALVIGLPTTTEARAQKRIVSATVNGKGVKWKGRLVLFDETPGHGFVAVATKIGGRKTIGFGCAILLEGQTFPLTTTQCNANYAAGRGIHVRTWLNPGLDPSNAIQVTFESFDGTAVQGTFSGTLLSTAIGDGSTLSVQGSFRGPLRK